MGEAPCDVRRGGLLAHEPQPGLEPLQRFAEAVAGRAARQQHHRAADSLDEHRIAFESVLLRQAHGLAAAGTEKFGSVHRDRF